MRILKFIAVLALSGTWAGMAQAQEQEARRIISEDAAAFFGGLCISTHGVPDRINRTIIAQRIKALPLSDEEVKTLLEGKAGDSGWVVVTGRGVELQLHVETPSTCNVRAMESSDDVANATLSDILKTLGGRDGFTYEKVMDETRQTNGGAQRLVGYRVAWRDGGWAANLSMSHIAGDGGDIPPQTTFTLALRQIS